MAEAKVRMLHTPRTFDVKKLTEGEMDFLIALTAAVGGDPSKSPAKYARRLQSKLVKAAGYDYQATDAHKLLVGSIFFNDYGTNPVTPEARLRLYDAVCDASETFRTKITAIQAERARTMTRVQQRVQRKTASLVLDYIAAAYNWGTTRGSG
jgi:hypothetical protein